MSENFSKERILKNSLLLYVRMLFTMWLNLYATRLTLANLGIEDMGVYGVIGSIVSLFTVFTGGITSAVQRFITFELGLENGNPNKVFCSSLNVIFILSGIMLVLLEVGGLWMLEYKVNIPEASRDASFWVFQLSVLTCIVNTISIPYNALIIAHEKMDAFAIISIVQVVLNFLAAYCLSLFEDNRLLIYAIILTIASVFVRLLYQMYCHRKFKEAHYHFDIDWNTIKQIGKFTGVTTLSGAMQVVSGQSIVFILNIFFGVAINGVYSIAIQLKNMTLSFSQNTLKAIAPQITKTYASNEIFLYQKLVYTGCKTGVFMLYFIMIPFLFNTEYILKLWLGSVPDYAIIFSQCTIFLSLIYAAFEPIKVGVLATNQIAKFLVIPELYYFLIIPCSYWVCKNFNNPAITIIIIVVVEIIICFMRIWYAIKLTPLMARPLIINVLIPCLFVGIFSSFIYYGLNSFFNCTLLGFISKLICNGLICCMIIYVFGLTRKERSVINIIVKKIL